MTFRRANAKFIDLNLPEENFLWDTTIVAAKLLQTFKPEFVISHEEFAVGPATRISRYPAVFITEWFTAENDMRMRALNFFDEILLIGDRGTFKEPNYLTSKIYETGPIVRPLRYRKKEFSEIRAKLRWPVDALTVCFVPGGWANESRQPSLDLIHEAFQLLPHERKHLVWVAGKDSDFVRSQYIADRRITVEDYTTELDMYMAASDLIITKTNRTTVREASSLGIPSISISDNSNPVSDTVIASLSSARLLSQKDLTPELLASSILESLTRKDTIPVASNERSSGLERVVARLLHHLEISGKATSQG